MIDISSSDDDLSRLASRQLHLQTPPSASSRRRKSKSTDVEVVSPRRRRRSSAVVSEPSDAAVLVWDGASPAAPSDAELERADSDTDESETCAFDDEEKAAPLSPSKRCGRTPKSSAASPPKKARVSNKKRQASAKENADASELEGMPDWSAWTVAHLQGEVQRFGFKSSRSRGVLEEQMTQVWLAIERGKREKLADKERKKEEKRLAAEAKKKTPTRKRRTTQKTKKAEDEDAKEDEEQAATVDVLVRVRDLVRQDSALYERILLYEPVHLDTFIELCTRAEVKVAKAALMRVLDVLCITFYTQDLANGGSRKRN